MEPHSIRIPGSGGLGLHVLEWSREGLPLVFLHGFGNDAHIWDDFAPALAPYYRTLALDLRGHGDSDWDPQQRYDYDFHVGDLEELTRRLEIERLVLVGHSLGGRVAALFAGAHPERIAGLVLVDSGPEVDARGSTRISLDVKKSSGSHFASVADYARALAHAYPAAAPRTIERMAKFGVRRREDGRYERKTDPNFYTPRLSRGRTEAEAREREATEQLWDALKKLACPALVVRGAASDVISPDCADRMVDEALAEGRLVVVPRAGHSVMTDNPESFLEALCGFALGDG